MHACGRVGTLHNLYAGFLVALSIRHGGTCRNMHAAFGKLIFLSFRVTIGSFLFNPVQVPSYKNPLSSSTRQYGD